MRVAIVSDYFFDYVGGAQTSMLQQKLALEQAGHHVVLVAPVRGFGARYQHHADGLRIRPAFTLPGLLLAVVPNNTRTRKRLDAYFRQERIDVVHVQTEFGLAHAAADVAATLGLPVVHTVHTLYWASDGSWHAPLAPFIRSALERILRTRFSRLPFTARPVDNVLRNLALTMALRADTVVSPSEHQARDLADAGVTGVIELVPNPIAASARPPVPLTAELASRPSFLWVARCESVKRPLVFAEAAIAALAQKPGSFTVDFVGDGTELASLRRLTADQSEIRVHGSLPHGEVLELMDRCSMVALTSLGFDNQPMTIAEAVSRERGVLYCDPKLREGLQNAGFLSKSADVAGLAEALATLADDPMRLVRLSEGAARDHELFSAETYVKRIVEIYRRSRSQPA
ncbi:MAG: hypothetical protein JWP30_1289 [Homoserinimonas sp.]|jgi:glycosyltransferase involved in cell wall biosynthesis|nr:hypothetical protein [Homoserinimonas sp.]